MPASPSTPKRPRSQARNDRPALNIPTIALVVAGIMLGIVFLVWAPVKPAGVFALLVSSPFFVFARVLHSWPPHLRG